MLASKLDLELKAVKNFFYNRKHRLKNKDKEDDAQVPISRSSSAPANALKKRRKSCVEPSSIVEFGGEAATKKKTNVRRNSSAAEHKPRSKNKSNMLPISSEIGETRLFLVILKTN